MEITIELIQERVEEYFHLKPGSISEETQKGDIVQARQKAMLLCKEFKLGSNHTIGEKLADRHESTVSIAIRKAKANAMLYRKEAEDIDELKKLIKEEWRDIPGFEGYYKASKTGKVKGVTRYAINKVGVNQLFKGVEMTFHEGRVHLRKNGNNVHWSFNRVMFETFGTLNPI